MCYSQEQSKKSLLINIIACYILYNYNNNNVTYKILALFFGFVGIMQLFDIIFWNNQNINDSRQASINYITTKIAMFANHLQPIILAYLIYFYTGSLGKVSKVILTIYIIVTVFYTFNAFDRIKYTQVSNADSRNNIIRPSLKWDWNSQEYSSLVYFIFLLTLSILSYENFQYPFNIVLVFINLFTFILSTYYYKGQSIGRFWCKFASWIPLLLILIRS